MKYCATLILLLLIGLGTSPAWALRAPAWTPTGSFGNARTGHTATLLPSGKVLVAGGRDDDRSSLVSAELYDPATGTWTETGPLAAARAGHAAILLPSGKVLVAGGKNRSALASAELYDPATGTWTATGALANAREGHTATLL
ncbi:MAG: kelch-like protein, partial [bacterium]|nr:kelch-like protein [bacterium]